MPKEKVYDSSEMFDFEVGWSKEGQNVQLGILTHNGCSIKDWLAGRSEIGSPSVDDPSKMSVLPSFESLWGTLDRSQINRLIRALRKARDEAYGRDE